MVWLKSNVVVSWNGWVPACGPLATFFFGSQPISACSTPNAVGSPLTVIGCASDAGAGCLPGSFSCSPPLTLTLVCSPPLTSGLTLTWIVTLSA